MLVFLLPRATTSTTHSAVCTSCRNQRTRGEHRAIFVLRNKEIPLLKCWDNTACLQLTGESFSEKKICSMTKSLGGICSVATWWFLLAGTERMHPLIITQADVAAPLQPLANRLAARLRAGFGVQLCASPLPGSTANLAYLQGIIRVLRNRGRDHCCFTRGQGNT